jgi:hypothetical protein
VSKTPEGAVKRAILDYLAARHILAFRMQSGVSFAEHKGRKRAIPYGVAGMADVLAFPWTFVDDPVRNKDIRMVIPLWIECKAAKGKQSELQRSFQAQVEAEGHRYIIARGIEDVEAALR